MSITLLVENGDQVEAGDLITDGSVNPHDIMKIKGARGVQGYIIREVLKVYKTTALISTISTLRLSYVRCCVNYRVDDGRYGTAHRQHC